MSKKTSSKSPYKMGYQKPAVILEQIQKQDCFSNPVAAALESNIITAKMLEDWGFRRIKLIGDGEEGFVFAANANQVIKLWGTGNYDFPNDNRDFDLLLKGLRDSRSLQHISWQDLGELDTSNYGKRYMGFVVKPAISTHKIKKMDRKIYDGHPEPKWMQKEIAPLNIPNVVNAAEDYNYGYMRNGRPVFYDCIIDHGFDPKNLDGNTDEQKALYPYIHTGKAEGIITKEDLEQAEKALGHEAKSYVVAVTEDGLYLHGGFPTVDMPKKMKASDNYGGLDTVLGRAAERKLKAQWAGEQEQPLAHYVEQLNEERRTTKKNSGKRGKI